MGAVVSGAVATEEHLGIRNLGRRKMNKRFVCLFLTIAICFSLVSCGQNRVDRVDLFDDIISNIEIMQEYSTGTGWGSTRKMLKQFGIVVDFSDKNEPEPIDAAFVEAYLEEHTKEEFLNNVIKLFLFLRDENNYNFSGERTINNEEWHNLYTTECSCQPLTTLLKFAMEYNGVEMNGVNESMRGTEGYYTEHPDAEPLPFEETHDGRFYDANGENGVTESKTDTGVVEHYGDYAIINITQYQYNRGQYGWENGEFKDVLPSWNKTHTSRLYYKGQEVLGVDFESEEEVFASNTSVVDINGELYRISELTLDIFNAYDEKNTHIYIDIDKVPIADK